MATVKELRIALGNFPVGETPNLLGREALQLTRIFHRALLDFPQFFLQKVVVPGHPLLWLEWVALCKTAGLVVLRSGRPNPEAVCLLLTGLESLDELEAIRRHAPMFRRHWPLFESAARPVAVCGYISPSLLPDRAVRTVFSTFANALFSLLGVGETDEGPSDEAIG